MYWTNISEIENSYLHDAAFVLSLQTKPEGGKRFKFRSIYMDKNGECAISYYGKLSKDEVKELMVNYCYPGIDMCQDQINPEYLLDYTYDVDSRSMEESDFTTIYTPDNVNYNYLKI